MDGPGGVDHTRSVVGCCEPTAKELLLLLRRLFKTVDCGTVARYGKPSKKFRWVTGRDTEQPGTDDAYDYVSHGVEYGFNAGLAHNALAYGTYLRMVGK